MNNFPNYERPPVVEVAMGVQFSELKAFCVPHVGLYWQTIREEFPIQEERAPLPRWTEQQESKAELLDQPPMARAWFKNELGERLIQVQRDKFLYNWVGHVGRHEYPRYPLVRESFLHHWQDFREFLAKNDLGRPDVDTCELTYVNHARRGDVWKNVADAGKLFTAFGWATRGSFLPTPDAARWFLRFSLPEGQGVLQVTVAPMTRQDDTEAETVLQMSLTARGRPAGEVCDASVEKWFDMAREWIVRGFADLATEEADALWGKHQ